MSDKVETMAWAGEVPWHGLGAKVADTLTPQEMLVAAQLDWTVSKQPIYTNFNGEFKPVKDRYAIQRDSDGRVLTTVTKAYHPVQNEEAFDFFKKFTEAGHMKMETAGSLDEGKYVWALASIDSSFSLKGEDEVKGYLLLLSPHLAGNALKALMTSVRVVCWNTLSYALDKNKAKGEMVFRNAHHTKFDDSVKLKAEMTLGLAREQFDMFGKQAARLSKKKVTDTEAIEFFDQLEGFDRAMKEEEAAKVAAALNQEVKEIKIPKLVKELEMAYHEGPGADLPSAKGTAWGLVNAVTYVVDHRLGKSRDLALRNAWIGTNAKLKEKAVDLAMAKLAA